MCNVASDRKIAMRSDDWNSKDRTVNDLAVVHAFVFSYQAPIFEGSFNPRSRERSNQRSNHSFVKEMGFVNYRSLNAEDAFVRPRRQQAGIVQSPLMNALGISVKRNREIACKYAEAEATLKGRQRTRTSALHSSRIE